MCVVDADMVLAPEFFEATLPYLCADKDAVVQTPQHYYNYNAAADPLDHASALKNHHCRHGLVHALGGISVNGSGFVARMSAVAEAGFWETWSVCEDQRLALALQRQGRRGYLPLGQPLQVGEAPRTVRDAYRQRARFIAGYLGNVLGPGGVVWDRKLPAVLRLMGNGLHQVRVCFGRAGWLLLWLEV
jgi:cellulose synthase/poly-beta-1,6-N-acetylglucosamine synthase-like glycosyltransferase